MRVLLFTLFLVCCSCSKQKEKVSIVLKNERVFPEVIRSLDASERALLSWYLYTYGNACDVKLNKIKCQILKELNIDNECNPDYLSNLLQWFSTDLLAPSKLNNCPNIPANSAIQNNFNLIILIKKQNKLSIEYIIKGLNNSQEKAWSFHNTDAFIIKGKSLVKVYQQTK